MPAERIPLPLVRLSAEGKRFGAQVAANIEFSIAGQAIRLEITVPQGATRRQDLLPIFWGLSELAVGIGVERQGAEVSCRKGCGACCRQLVPVSTSEARALAALVAAMPEPRRSAVRARFADALQQMTAAGVKERLESLVSRTELRPIGMQYFGLGIACPFLEEESCSIHANRPLACREYLVTSPAEACARPTPETLRMVPIPVAVGSAVCAWDQMPGDGELTWVPLPAALAWAEAHPHESAPQQGPRLLQAFFKHLAGELPQAGLHTGESSS